MEYHLNTQFKVLYIMVVGPVCRITFIILWIIVSKIFTFSGMSFFAVLSIKYCLNYKGIYLIFSANQFKWLIKLIKVSSAKTSFNWLQSVLKYLCTTLFIIVHKPVKEMQLKSSKGKVSKIFLLTDFHFSLDRKQILYGVLKWKCNLINKKGHLNKEILECFYSFK